MSYQPVPPPQEDLRQAAWEAPQPFDYSRTPPPPGYQGHLNEGNLPQPSAPPSQSPPPPPPPDDSDDDSRSTFCSFLKACLPTICCCCLPDHCCS